MDASKNTEQYWTYTSAPDSPTLRGMGITSRQLRRWVEQGKLSHIKPGNRVIFSEALLRELVERSTVNAVR